MIRQECIDELADFVGLKAEVSQITERAMRGEIAFEPALRERVALLKGLSLSVVDEIVASRITLMPGGKELVRTMKANGAYTALVSGGFTVFTSRIGAMIGFDEDRSNILELDGESLAGRVRDPILGKEAKRERLLALRSERGLSPRRNHGGRRWGERSRDAGRGRARRGSPREASRRRRCAGAHRPWRSDRAALPAGIRARRFRRLTRSKEKGRPEAAFRSGWWKDQACCWPQSCQGRPAPSRRKVQISVVSSGRDGSPDTTLPVARSSRTSVMAKRIATVA